jgi:hypothetical protein
VTVHFPANILFETSAAFGPGPIVVPGSPVSARWRLPGPQHDGKRLPLVVELVADQTQFIEVLALYTHATTTLSWTAADVSDGTSGPGALVTFNAGAKRIASIARAFDLNEIAAAAAGWPIVKHDLGANQTSGTRLISAADGGKIIEFFKGAAQEAAFVELPNNLPQDFEVHVMCDGGPTALAITPLTGAAIAIGRSAEQTAGFQADPRAYYKIKCRFNSTGSAAKYNIYRERSALPPRTGATSYTDTSPTVGVDGAFVHRLSSATADRTITVAARGVGDRVIIVNETAFNFTLNPGTMVGAYRSMFIAEWTGSAWNSIYSDARPPSRLAGGDFENGDLVSLAAANYTLLLDDGPFMSFHSQPDGTRKVFRPTASHGLFILQNADGRFPITFDDGTPAVPGNQYKIPPRRARMVYWRGSAWGVGVEFGQEGNFEWLRIDAAVTPDVGINESHRGKFIVAANDVAQLNLTFADPAGFVDQTPGLFCRLMGGDNAFPVQLIDASGTKFRSQNNTPGWDDTTQPLWLGLATEAANETIIDVWLFGDNDTTLEWRFTPGLVRANVGDDARATSTVQTLSAADVQALGGYTVLRTSSRITVRLNEDLSAPATTTSPANALEGDEVDYIRHAGGFHPWTIDGNIILLGRDDRVTLRWFDGQWIEIYPPRDDVVFRRGAGGNSNHYDTDTIQAFTAAGTYTLQDPQGQSTNFEVILLQVGAGVVTLAFPGGSTLTQVPAGGPLVTNGPGTALRVKAIGSSQVWVRRVIVDPGAGAGDAAPSIAEFEGSGPLSSSHLASKNVDVHAGANSINFQVPVNVEGRFIINAFDEDTGAPYHSCTVSVVGNAGSVNGSAGALGVREMVAGGVAIVSVIDPSGTAPIVKVSGDIFEPPPTRGATTATKDDHRKVIEITGTQTFGAATGFPVGFVAVYIASGANRTLNGPGATDFEILDGGSAAVRRMVDGRLVASGAGNGYGTKVLS